jgi:hypothetical protein
MEEEEDDDDSKPQGTAITLFYVMREVCIILANVC